jgi:hypothetical protein
VAAEPDLINLYHPIFGNLVRSLLSSDSFLRGAL